METPNPSSVSASVSADSSISNFPIRIKQQAAEIDQIHTEFMALEFADRFFVIVTQYGRIGTLMHSVCDLTPDGRQVFSATTLLGRRDDDGISDLCARQLQERVAKTSRKPVLLAISLKQNSVEMLQTVLSILDTDAIKLW